MMGFGGGSSISWTICKIICTSLLTDNHTNTSLLIFTGLMLFQTPNQQFESTELNVFSLLCSNMKYNCRMYE